MLYQLNDIALYFSVSLTVSRSSSKESNHILKLVSSASGLEWKLLHCSSVSLGGSTDVFLPLRELKMDAFSTSRTSCRELRNLHLVSVNSVFISCSGSRQTGKLVQLTVGCSYSSTNFVQITTREVNFVMFYYELSRKHKQTHLSFNLFWCWVSDLCVFLHFRSGKVHNISGVTCVTVLRTCFFFFLTLSICFSLFKVKMVVLLCLVSYCLQLDICVC